MTFTAKVATRIEEQRAELESWSDVEPQEVSWLWPGRLARGKYCVLMGLPDLGKTTIALDVAARVSVGKAWPDGAACPKGRVLILTAERGGPHPLDRFLSQLRWNPVHDSSCFVC